MGCSKGGIMVGLGCSKGGAMVELGCWGRVGMWCRNVEQHGALWITRVERKLPYYVRE